jgi:hypothetical protein
MDNKFDDFFMDAVEELLRNYIPEYQYHIDPHKFIITFELKDEDEPVDEETEGWISSQLHKMKDYWGADDRWQW